MNMRNSTLLFLVKKNGEVITDICLAMKKRGFGAGRYNGVGGKVEEGETIEYAVKRETREEVHVVVNDIHKCAELAFTFPHNESWNQLVHVYFAFSWEDDPLESEEMKPYWFSVNDIPFKEMWPDDIYWLPNVLQGKYVKGAFTFGEGDVILDKKVEVI